MHFVKASVRLGTKGFFARACARNGIVIGGKPTGSDTAQERPLVSRARQTSFERNNRFH